MNKDFTHLHLHTQYSLLDGAIRLKDLVVKAQEFNMSAIAQTDHGNMFGAIDFYTQMKAAGIKPILGSEVYFTPGSRFSRGALKNIKGIASQDEDEARHQIHHLVLLAKNKTGHDNLCKILSKAYLEGFYYKPRTDIELLKEHSEGLIALSACLKGEVAYNYMIEQDQRAIDSALKFREVFKDDFYLEIQENGLPEQTLVNKKILKLAKEQSIPLVATNDCHYLLPEDAKAHEVLMCIQTGKTLEDENRMKLTTNEFYFKSKEIMRESFSYIPEACDNTMRIADMCNLDLKWTDDTGNPIYLLPDFKIETEESTDDCFRRLAREGLEERFKGPHFKKLIVDPNWEEKKKVYYDRLKFEVDMIIQMEFPGYFLIVQDFINWSKQNDIPVGPGRGSGAGSIVAYSLNITNINPIPYNLLFERFINPERISMPDFDVDFCQERRGEVIEYVTNKYGKDRVAQIITFGKLQAKAAIKDVSRVFGLPYKEADILSKLIPDELKITIDKALEMEPKLVELQKSDSKIREIIRIARRLEGLLRHASIHAAGVIITNQPLVDYCPLYKGKEDEQVVQYDKDFSEMIGLVKFDFLGLKTLTVIRNAVRFIHRDHDKDFDIEAIDMADKGVYDFVSSGNTVGVFQLESSGMIDLCKRLSPDNIEDITAINALYRPGPLGSGMVDDFIEIKHGRKETVYPFAELEDILKETYGIIIYQEQVMNIARIVASYTLGQADMLRRAMGKKKEKEMIRHKKIFLDGAEKNNFNLKTAEELYDLMAKFAEYGFNKSHAMVYGVIAYQTAFLKHYFPGPFYAALLSTEMRNTDKVTQYVNDLKENGLNILPPDINESLWAFNVLGDSIRFGMGAIKNVGEGAVAEIIRERDENGVYQGFVDFCTRSNYKAINKRVIESLIKVGAFDESEEMNRKTLLANMEMIIAYSQKRQQEKELGQTSLFQMPTDEKEENNNSELQIEKLPVLDETEKLSYEAELMGIYVSGHPLDKYSEILKKMSSMPISEIKEIHGSDERNLSLAGMIATKRQILTKKGDRMAFATLEDLTGKIECIVFPKVYAECEELLDSDEPLLFTGMVRLSEDPRKMFPNKITSLKEEADESISGIDINLNIEDATPHTMAKLKETILSYRGAVPVNLNFKSSSGMASMPLGEQYCVAPSIKLASKINQIFNNNCVQFNMSNNNNQKG